MVLNEGEEVVLMKQALLKEEVDSLEYFKLDEDKHNFLEQCKVHLFT